MWKRGDCNEDRIYDIGGVLIAWLLSIKWICKTQRYEIIVHNRILMSLRKCLCGNQGMKFTQNCIENL